MAELNRQFRAAALVELERIEQVLSVMSAWADGESPERERCAIMLEDAAKTVMAAAWLLQHVQHDSFRASELIHRRLPAPLPD